MSYDSLAESVRLLAGAPPSGTARLSRRVRHVPLAVDRDGDVAVTLFLRRGVGGVALLEAHTLELTHDVWRQLGGGGGPGDEALGGRPRLADLGGPAVGSSSGGTARSGRPGGWVSWSQLRVAREVPVLRVGARRVPVADHGVAVVVWTGAPPDVVALDAAGAVLGSVPLHGAGLRRWYSEDDGDDGKPLHGATTCG